YTNDLPAPKCPSPQCGSAGLVFPNGQRLKTTNGLEFAQTSGNTLVPWKGTATANVVALIPGSTGNVGDHTITTIEDSLSAPSRVSVTNPQATGHGTDPSSAPLMSEADFDAGRAQLEQSLHQELAQLLQAAQGSGEKLSQTIVFGSPQFNTDHKPGDNVPSFNGTMTVQGEGDFYVDADV